MLKTHCKLLIKGGLAVQLSLTQLFKDNDITEDDIFELLKKDTSAQEELYNLFKFNSKHNEEDDILSLVYSTNDIDLLVQPINDRPPEYYAKQIANMLLWIFEEINDSSENLHVLSTQDKTTEVDPSKKLIKISMAESMGGKKKKYTAIIDINITLPDTRYYEPLLNETIHLGNGLNGAFNFTSIQPLIIDRISHIIKYKNTVTEMVNTIPSLTGATKISDIFGGHPDFKYLNSVNRSINALIEGLLIVEVLKKNNRKPLAEIKTDILNGYISELKLEAADEELITNFVFNVK
jgi:hypothetical protein